MWPLSPNAWRNASRGKHRDWCQRRRANSNRSLHAETPHENQNNLLPTLPKAHNKNHSNLLPTLPKAPWLQSDPGPERHTIAQSDPHKTLRSNNLKIRSCMQSIRLPQTAAHSTQLSTAEFLCHAQKRGAISVSPLLRFT